MKIRSYKEYKSNGFILKYYTRIINDYGVRRTIIIAYCDGRRMKDFSGEEKYALRSIICRLADEQRASETDAYIKEQAARMGVSEYIVRAHIEEVERKNMKATVPAEKPEITAEDIALYDYALGGAPVEGYTISYAETILKSMKKAGITPAAVDRARKKMKKQQPAPAAPVVDAPAADEQPAAFTPHIESNGDLHYENYTVKDDNGNVVVFGSYIPAGLLQNAPASDDAPAAPVADEQPAAAPSIKNADTPSNQKKQLAAWNGAVVEILEICAADNTAVVKIKGGTRTRIPADALNPTTAKKTTLPAWMMPGAVIDVKNAVRNDAPSTRHTIESVKSTNIYYTDGTYNSINYIMHYGSPVDDAPAAPVVDAPVADAAPASDSAPALTDADVLAAAARIKSNYEAIKQQAAADTFADAITAYCEALETPAAPAWTPEVITLTPCPAWDDTPAADEQPAPAPRARRRLNIAPRLSRWLHPARWVAVVFVVCLLSGLLLGMNTSTAADAAADDIAAVYELHPVTVTASSLTNAPATPSPVKKLAAPSTVKNVADAAECSSQKTDTADTPAGEKTASPMNTGSDPHGLTICEGTPWAYTMMNWA